MNEPDELAVVIDNSDSVWQRLDGLWYECGSTSRGADWTFLLRHRQPLRRMTPISDGTP